MYEVGVMWSELVAVKATRIPPHLQGQGRGRGWASGVDHVNTPQAPQEWEQRLTELHARIQQQDKVIVRLRQQGPHVSPLPQIGITPVPMLPAKYLVDCNRLVPL
uniref:Uncharacterized protein n=1 Tax=Cannabis sativa TaxID=3483 RepID=A0A803PLS4_CANSA